MQKMIDIVLEAEQLEGTQAVVSQWLVKPGDLVVKDSPIVELETDKVAIEVSASCDGTLNKISAQVGDKVVAGDLLAIWNAVAAPEQVLVTEPTAQPSNNHQKASQNISLAVDNSKRHLLGPAVKRLLASKNISPEDVQATGCCGRISKADVERHIAQLPSLEINISKNATSVAKDLRSSRFIAHSPMRSSIAKHMVESLLETSPHVTSVFAMDMSAIIAHRAKRKLGYQDAGVNLTFSAYFLAASAAAIQVVPEINSQFHEQGLQVFDQINIGVGTALADSGLVVPVVNAVQTKSLFEIAAALTEQTAKARARKLTAADMQGGTFTLSNYGVSGSLLATPIIINQPQVAILGVGKMEKRVVVETIDNNDTMVIKPMCYVSLSIDHRALDAYQTNKFLSEFVNVIENWE